MFPRENKWTNTKRKGHTLTRGKTPSLPNHLIAPYIRPIRLKVKGIFVTDQDTAEEKPNLLLTLVYAQGVIWGGVLVATRRTYVM